MRHIRIKKVIGITVFIILAVLALGYVTLIGYLHFSAEKTREVHYDISEYGQLKDGRNVLEIFSYGMEGNECIWPVRITDYMDVQDYLLVYYCPWDSNYLGYLTVSYENSDYKEEVARLSEYSSVDYVGNYGATGFSDYQLIAMSAGDYGFVYALTDSEETIIYVAMIFPGYGMDILYDEYIPEEYLPDGLDISRNNPTRQKILERNQ